MAWGAGEAGESTWLKWILLFISGHSAQGSCGWSPATILRLHCVGTRSWVGDLGSNGARSQGDAKMTFT